MNCESQYSDFLKKHSIKKLGIKWVSVITLYTEVLALYFIIFFSCNKPKFLFNENTLEFRGVMPECIFVLLGPWNRYRCFLKDQRNAMGTLHTRLQTYKERIIVFIFLIKGMRVTSFGLLTLMGVACLLLLIIVSCSDMIYSPALFTAFPLMILDRF